MLVFGDLRAAGRLGLGTGPHASWIQSERSLLLCSMLCNFGQISANGLILFSEHPQGAVLSTENLEKTGRDRWPADST